MNYQELVKQGVYDALVADSALMTKVAGVYDAVPQDSDPASDDSFPFVSLGDAVAVEWDTDSELGCDIVLRIDVWSRYEGKKEAHDVMALIYDCLHRQSITAVGLHVVGVDWQQSECFLDADGVTRHGVTTYRVTVED